MASIYLSFDTSRKTSPDIHSCHVYADTNRDIKQEIKTNLDIKRVLYKPFNLSADSRRRMPYHSTLPAAPAPPSFNSPWSAVSARSGVKSMTISLSELTLTDSFSVETTDSVEILQAVHGQILDYPYEYVIDSTDQQNIVMSAHGTYDTDVILYTPIKYEITTEKKLSEHAGFIAGALGKTLKFNSMDFKHSSVWSGNGNTYSSIIGSLFGWSSVIPHKQINVFMRAADNSLNVVQRGREATVTDITNIPHTMPMIHKELIRTLWETGNGPEDQGNKSAHSLIIEPTPFSGTKQAGKTELTYTNGLLVSEVTDGNETTYEYIGSKSTGYYIDGKETKNADGSRAVTSYEYAITHNGRMLVEEEEKQYSKQGRLIKTRTTSHGSLGQGFYSTIVYEDGEYVASSINTGAPGSSVSVYTYEQESISMGGANYASSAGLANTNTSLIDYAQFPTNDKSVLADLTAELVWLNRKIKETVKTTIYNTNHVIDFNERIKLNGNEYYLVNNTITHNTRELKQELELVRWY